MKEVYLISCSKRKRDYKCLAKDMYYPSSLFRASLNYALSYVLEKDIYILSAKYHLISLDKIIEPYDLTLKNFKKDEKEKWSKNVLDELKNNFDINNTKFIILAGNSYTEYILKSLPNYKIPIPLEYRSIGKRIAWLKSNTKVDSKMVLAKQLRNKKYLMEIPNTPGYYKWWLSKEDLKKILNSPYLEKNYLKEIAPYLTSKKILSKNYYYVYVGIAVNESV